MLYGFGLELLLRCEVNFCCWVWQEYFRGDDLPTLGVLMAGYGYMFFKVGSFHAASARAVNRGLSLVILAP